MDQKKKYIFSKNICVLDLDANTPGNTNAHCIDSSMFAGSGAVQSNSLYQPVLADNVFGAGIKGYVFDGSNDYMLVDDSDRFSFTNNTSDSPFSIEISFKFNTVNECWFVNKRSSSTNLEYQVAYYLGGWHFCMFDSDYQHYIGCKYSLTPIADYNYVLKFTYDGSGSAIGTKIFQNGIQLNVTPFNTGSFIYHSMKNSTSIINIGRFGQGGYNFNGDIEYVKIWKGVI